MLILTGVLITACGAATPPAPQTLPMGDFVFGQILLNDVVVTNWDKNIECHQNDIQLDCSKVDPTNWVTFKKVNSSLPASIELVYDSPNKKTAELFLIKSGDKECPPQAAGLFTACEFIASKIKYLK